MPFKKRYICAEIALILSSGLLLASIPTAAQAQLPQFSCRANEAGDGWICESDQTPASSNTVRTTTRPLSNREASTGTGDENRPERQAATPTQAAPETTEPLEAIPADTQTQIQTMRSSEPTWSEPRMRPVTFSAVTRCPSTSTISSSLARRWVRCAGAPGTR